MSTLINTDICQKVICKYYTVGGEEFHCDILLPECKAEIHTHHGCLVPQKCLYKNLHIIKRENPMLLDGDDYEGCGCGDCKYRPEEYK